MQDVGEAASARRTRLTAAQRRESILDAATEVFAAAGYRAGKVSDVATRLGVTEPVIFQNFGSKAALYAAVLDRMVSDIRAELQAPADHRGSAPELLAHVLSPHPDSRPHGPGARHGILADAATLAAEPDLTEAARRAARTLADHLADVLRRGQADGDIRTDTDPDAAAWLLLSVLSARRLRAAALPDPDRIEEDVIAFTLQALAPATPAPPPTGHDKHGQAHHL